MGSGSGVQMGLPGSARQKVILYSCAVSFRAESKVDPDMFTRAVVKRVQYNGFDWRNAVAAARRRFSPCWVPEREGLGGPDTSQPWVAS
jgi:hypothetical protein